MHRLLFPGFERNSALPHVPSISYLKEREPLPALRPPRPPKDPSPAHVRKVWRAGVKNWLDNHSTRVDLRTSAQKERQAAELTAWFYALDVDSSGSIEEHEIRKFFQAMGMRVSKKQLVETFQSIGKDINAELTMNEFVRLMTRDPERLRVSSDQGETWGMFDPRTRLLMLSYRRQRVLQDVEDLSIRKSGRFRDMKSFADHYGTVPPDEVETEEPLTLMSRASSRRVGERQSSQSSRKSFHGKLTSLPTGSAITPTEQHRPELSLPEEELEEAHEKVAQTPRVMWPAESSHSLASPPSTTRCKSFVMPTTTQGTVAGAPLPPIRSSASFM
ncbi:hypothetical protein AB1Y20_015256 [Prymnesium parvum]|uniref:EF-hand domain-containing protein n=1 Tax=Prymnesium parvum TaxID=97485 RepID=A0AB34JWI9_PRYPA|mmetsp:Transcript_18075/g.45297  ORF Transcript_18075/g.45297 Transcript_18075/m.45297 type:complete len:331 (-) Transcript_18075:242-1234(-)